MENKKMQFEIPVILHNEVKVQAAFRNLSIKKYVMAAILEKMRRDKEVE